MTRHWLVLTASLLGAVGVANVGNSDGGTSRADAGADPTPDLSVSCSPKNAGCSVGPQCCSGTCTTKICQ